MTPGARITWYEDDDESTWWQWWCACGASGQPFPEYDDALSALNTHRLTHDAAVAWSPQEADANGSLYLPPRPAPEWS